MSARRYPSTTAADRFVHWESVRKGLDAAVAQLSDEQLLFSPKAGLWTVGETACHIAEAEEGWFRHYIAGRVETAPEFCAHEYATVTGVRQLLSEVHGKTMEFLDGIDEDDLGELIVFPWGTEAPLSWVIWHVLEHEIHHRGEIYLMLGLLGLEAPDV